MDEKIKNWIERKVCDDYTYATDCVQYDNMVAMKWELPTNLSVYDWVRKRVSTVAADIIKQACNIFDTFSPKFELLPRGPEDADAAEKLERWGEFQMQQANDGGDIEPFREIMRSSVTYDRICAQLEYVDDSEYPFCIHVHHPSTVHYELGGGVVRKVCVVANVYASTVLEHWSSYAEVKGMSELQKLVDDDDEQRVVSVDYVDGNIRLVFFFKTDQETIPDDFEIPDETTVILESPKKRFVNWAIVKGSSGSLLDSLYKSGLIENQNLLDTIADSTILRRGFAPLIKHKSAVPGKELEVDFSADANGVMELGPGEDADYMNIPPLDPGVRELMDRNSAKMNSTSGIQNLSGLQATNTQYATLNALIELKMTELTPYERNAEKALGKLMKMMFLFVQDGGKPIVSLRKSESKYGVKGSKIVVAPEDFDPRALFISCTLLPNTPTDQMQKMNMFSLMMQAGLEIPHSEIVERMGMGNPEVNRAKWEEEQVANTMLEAFKQEQMAKVQLQVQQMQMAMQMQMQSQAQQQMQPQGQPNPDQGQPAFQGQQGQGMNPAMGGSSPYEGAPQMTQTQVPQ